MGELDKSGGFLETAIDTLQDVFIVFDLNGDLVSWNKAGKDVTGYTDEEAAGMNISHFFTRDDLARVQSTIARGLRNGYASLEMDLLCKSGSSVPYEFYGTPLLDSGGNAVGITAIGRDITERRMLIEKEKEASAATAAREAAERHSRELQNLITIAAHELRHPATVFKGYAAILLNKMDSMDRWAVEDALQAISQSADRLAHLVSELFETSVMDREDMQLNLRSVPPHELLVAGRERAVSLGVENKGGIDVLPSDLDPVTADSEKVEEVIAILIENGVKFSGGGPVEARCERGEGLTVFKVADRGPGVPDQDREKIFDRFYQVEDPVHHSLPGIGLGLYIARAVVLAHGGSIGVVPRDGGGSVFSFTIPDTPGEAGP